MSALYGITQDYGYDPSYPLNKGSHRGIDYGYPWGVPVLVNGVPIGLSGSTGEAYDANGNKGTKAAAHVHVGRWVNGQPTNPGRGNGFEFEPPVSVAAVGSDAVNGNWVKLNAEGAIWVYCHLSEIKVRQGQQLEGGETMPSEKDVRDYFYAFLRTEPSEAQVAYYTKRSWRAFIDDVLLGLRRGYDNQLADLRAALANEQAKPPKEVIKTVEKIVDKPLEVRVEVPVPTPVDEQKVVEGWLSRLWKSLFKKDGK